MIAAMTRSCSSTFDDDCRVRDITSPDNSPKWLEVVTDFTTTNTHIISTYIGLSHLKEEH